MLGEKDIYYEADRTDPANQMAGLSRMVAIDYKKTVAGKFVLVEVAAMVIVTPSSCA